MHHLYYYGYKPILLLKGDENFANQLLERITDKVLLFNFKVRPKENVNYMRDLQVDLRLWRQLSVIRSKML